MKTVLLQVITPNILSYAEYVIKINKRWANKFGYDYKIIDTVLPDRHPSWGKIKGVIETLPHYDRLFLLDADAFVNNDKISLDKFSSSSLIKICRNDDNGGELLNCGSMIFINDTLTNDLLQHWYDMAEESVLKFNSFWEQSILNSLHNNGIYCPIDKRFEEIIEVFPMRAFNSWWLDISHNYDPDQFIQHIMARSDREKAEIIKNFYHSTILF